MSGSVRMMDLTALTRGLEEFRRLDPEQRVQIHRVGTEAAVHRVEEAHRDVHRAEEAAESQVREHPDHQHRRRQHREPPELHADREPDPPPEQDEGHLLDIKV